ncbi:hypothetical protein FHX52_3184 [Humibacillus xanthopallidus]|uniref:histidine kinase n=1 Tax=Humibacillus xanthopallidus TaxID=412689 RepID=A0A543PQV8_9MICO|nr:hypothetical protein [Humibacillus xanthopallidus]TQN46460.1 hypothetical protein FHX52_3184 [Humibacillus xanthopallidus]
MLLVAATSGLAIVAASVAIPALRFLRTPDVVTLVAGLVVMACGLWSIRMRVPGSAPGLVFAAGATWLLPDLAASGLGWFDDAFGRLALVHVGILTQALMIRAMPRGFLRATVVVLGYGCAASAFIGGYRALLLATGLALVAVGLAAPRVRPTEAATAGACVSFGVGLALPPAALLLSGSPATPWGAGLHAVAFTVSSGLLTFAMTTVAAQSDPIADLDRTLSTELGTPVTLVLTDGGAGWIDPFGRPIPAPSRSGTAVRDAGGHEVGRLLGARVSLEPRVVRTVGLAATNARLRHDLLRQVEELSASRARVLDAAESERAAVLGELRHGILEPLADLERRLRVAGGLTGVADQAADAGSRLERLVENVDPFRHGEMLSAALQRMAGPASRGVVVGECVEPVDPAVRRTAWFCCAEALANSRKHAPGAHIELTVSAAPGGVLVRITDDGPGGADQAGGGLTGLRDRVHSLGGMLRVESGLGGTIVEARIPDLVLVVDHDTAGASASYREGPRHGGSS